MIFTISLAIVLLLAYNMPAYVIGVPALITAAIAATAWKSLKKYTNLLLAKAFCFFITMGVFYMTQTLALGLWLMKESGTLWTYKFTGLVLGPFQQTTLVIVAAVAGIAYAMKKTHSPIKKIKLLVAELCVLSVVIVISKNEQYLPIYLLVEFGTCTFLINALKQHLGSSQKDARVYPAILIGFLALTMTLLYGSGSAYWQSSLSPYLSPTQQQSDFGALKLSIYHLLKQITLPLLVFILVITVLLIAISKRPVTINTNLTIKKIKNKVLKSAYTTNQQNDTSVKNGSSTTNKFNK